MKAIEHCWGHSKHVVTRINVGKLIMHPLETTHSWSPILSPIHILVNMHSNWYIPWRNSSSSSSVISSSIKSSSSSSNIICSNCCLLVSLSSSPTCHGQRQEQVSHFIKQPMNPMHHSLSSHMIKFQNSTYIHSTS